MRKALFWLTKRATHVFGKLRAAIVLPLMADTAGRGGLLLGRSPKFVARGRLEIGERFRVRTNTIRGSIEVGRQGVLRIGDDVSLNQGVVIYAEELIEIGSRVAIGDGVRIYDTGFHAVKPGGRTKVAPVRIEDDVWIAVNVMILPGVTIGRGSVIAGGTVLTKSVPPGSIVGGKPGAVLDSFEVPQDFRRRGPRSEADAENRARRAGAPMA